jgi:hypothetical protein
MVLPTDPEFPFPIDALVRIELETGETLWVRTRTHDVVSKSDSNGKSWTARLRWQQHSQRVVIRPNVRNPQHPVVTRMRDGKLVLWRQLESMPTRAACGNVAEAPVRPSRSKRRRTSSAPVSSAPQLKAQKSKEIAHEVKDSHDVESAAPGAAVATNTRATAVREAPRDETPEHMRRQRRCRTLPERPAASIATVPASAGSVSTPRISACIRETSRKNAEEPSSARSTPQNRNASRMPRPIRKTESRCACASTRNPCPRLAKAPHANRKDLENYNLHSTAAAAAGAAAATGAPDTDLVERTDTETRIALLDELRHAHAAAAAATSSSMIHGHPVPATDRRSVKYGPHWRFAPLAAIAAHARSLATPGVVTGVGETACSTLSLLKLLAEDTRRLVDEILILASGTDEAETTEPAKRLPDRDTTTETLGRILLAYAQALVSVAEAQAGSGESQNTVMHDLGKTALQALIQAERSGIREPHFRHALRTLIRGFVPATASADCVAAISAILEEHLPSGRIERESHRLELLCQVVTLGPDLLALASVLRRASRNQTSHVLSAVACPDLRAPCSTKWYRQVVQLYEIGARTIANQLTGCWPAEDLQEHTADFLVNGAMQLPLLCTGNLSEHDSTVAPVR